MSHQKKKSRESSREFSDLNVSLRDDPLTADLRTNLQKCTDQHQCLYCSSKHLDHMKNSIIYYQTLRLSNISKHEGDLKEM